MAELEREVLDRRLRELGLVGPGAAEAPCRRFRINAGMAWAGEVARRGSDFLVLKNPRPFWGAPIGWPDLAGWDSVLIRPKDVPPEGLRVAIFAGDEGKTPNVRLSREQKIFRDVLVRHGGRFEVIR